MGRLECSNLAAGRPADRRPRHSALLNFGVACGSALHVRFGVACGRSALYAQLGVALWRCMPTELDTFLSDFVFLQPGEELDRLKARETEAAQKNCNAKKLQRKNNCNATKTAMQKKLQKCHGSPVVRWSAHSTPHPTLTHPKPPQSTSSPLTNL